MKLHPDIGIETVQGKHHETQQLLPSRRRKTISSRHEIRILGMAILSLLCEEAADIVTSPQHLPPLFLLVFLLQHPRRQQCSSSILDTTRATRCGCRCVAPTGSRTRRFLRGLWFLARIRRITIRGVLLALLRAGGLFQRVRETLLCKLMSTLNELLLVGFFCGKDGNHVVGGVWLVALDLISTNMKTKNVWAEITYLQTLISLKLADCLLRENMTARHQINRLYIRTQLLRRDGTDPPLTLVLLSVRGMGFALCVDFKLQLHDVPESLDPSTEDLFAIGLGADAVGFVAGKKESENGVFVVEIPDAVGDNGSHQLVVRYRTCRPRVFLLFALRLFYLRCAGVAGRFADELATGWDTGDAGS